MEKMFIRHAKSRSGGVGVSGLLTNNAFQRWVRMTHAQSHYANVTFQIAGLKKNGLSRSKHQTMACSEIDKSEKCVQQAVGAFRCFINPLMLKWIVFPNPTLKQKIL